MPTLNANADAQLIIQLKPTVQFLSQRLPLASRVFEGKPIITVLRELPLLFNVCAQAQSVAAVRAIANACGLDASPALEQRRDLLLALESLREHAWRLLLDWPEQLGLVQRTETFAPLYQALNRLLKTANPDGVYTLSADTQQIADQTDLRQDWQACRTAVAAALDRAWENTLLEQLQTKNWGQVGEVTSAALPSLPAVEIAKILQSDQAESFITAPEWQGHCRETGPWPRQQANLPSHWGTGLPARLAARFLESRALLEQITALLEGEAASKHIPAKAGVAQVEAARGRLIHSVVLDAAQSRIAAYRILAPTDWNFHPQGVAAQMLQSLPDQDPAEHVQLAGLVLLAIDPCVAYRLQDPYHA